jgi:hypothetical protein
MSTHDEDVTPVTPEEPGIDAIGHSHDIGTEDDPDQNPPLPDWGPTDGTHGTDAE